MAITYDLRKLDIDNLTEFWERKEFSDDYDNWTLFQSFVFRLVILRPSKTGEITIDAAKLAIERNHIWEVAVSHSHLAGINIPDMFIRRMIGLDTNIFPMHSDEQFNESVGRELRTSAMVDFNRERINF